MQQSWISYFSNLVKAHGGINLAQGIPGFQPPQALLEILSEQAKQPIHQYAPGLGNQTLRQHIADEYQEKISSQFDFMITLGGTEAIQLIYLYLHHKCNGLNVAAFSPVYESYQHLPAIYSDKFKSIPIDSPSLETDLVEFFRDYQPNVFFVNTPGNPYGKSLSKEIFDKLIELSKQHHTFIIIDAVYDKFHFSKNLPYYPYSDFTNNVFFVNSFSKRYSITGWRLGFFFAHHSHFEKLVDIHDYTGLSCPSVLQESLAKFLNSPKEPNQYIETVRSLLTRNFNTAADLLTNHGFFIPQTDGGYFIWAKLPNGFEDGTDFAKKLYQQQKTAVIPGAHFGADFKNYIRINIAQFPEKLNTGIQNIIQQTAIL
jgi:aminotransferase